MSWLKFVRQLSRAEVDRHIIFFERQDIENERFGVVRCVLGYKFGFETLVKKPKYIFSLSPM